MGKLNVRRLGIFVLLLGAAGVFGADEWNQTLEGKQTTCLLVNALSESWPYSDCTKSDDPKLLLIGGIALAAIGVSLLILTATSRKATDLER